MVSRTAGDTESVPADFATPLRGGLKDTDVRSLPALCLPDCRQGYARATTVTISVFSSLDKMR
jgi:hypothetical protein